MTISKEKIREVAKKYYIFNGSEAEDAFRFAWEIICEERDAIAKAEPYATTTIHEFEIAEHVVYDLVDEVMNAI